ELIDAELTVDSSGDELFAVDEAITALAAEDPRAAKLVELRFFVGMTLEKAATVLQIDRRTAYRDWAHARPWLRAHLNRGRRRANAKNPCQVPRWDCALSPERHRCGPPEGYPWSPPRPRSLSSSTRWGSSHPRSGGRTSTRPTPTGRTCAPGSRPSSRPTT